MQCLRPLIPMKKNRPFTVVVEGNIGSGKTTFLDYFAKFTDVEVLQEPVNRWRDVQGHNLLVCIFIFLVNIDFFLWIILCYFRIFCTLIPPVGVWLSRHMSNLLWSISIPRKHLPKWNSWKDQYSVVATVLLRIYTKAKLWNQQNILSCLSGLNGLLIILMWMLISLVSCKLNHFMNSSSNLNI